MKEVRALVIDDDPILRSMMVSILRQANYQVCGEASTPSAGLKLATENRPQLILLDINLPEMNGIVLLEHLLKIEPKPKIVMVSGEATLDRVKESLSKGAAGFVVKPFNAARLLGVTEKAVPPPPRPGGVFSGG